VIVYIEKILDEVRRKYQDFFARPEMRKYVYGWEEGATISAIFNGSWEKSSSSIFVLFFFKNGISNFILV